jgi:serine/threonine-protein kinase
MYEMLTGKRPFGPGKASEVFRQHREDPPPPFVERAPLIPVPAAIEAITMRLLAKDPDERFQSGDEVVAALQRSVAGKPRAFPQSSVELADIEIPDMKRGSRLGRFLLTLAFLAFILGGAFYGLRQRGLLPKWAADLPDTLLSELAPGSSEAESSETASPKREVDGVGAAGWTARLLAAPGKKDWKGGAQALAALAELDRTALRGQEVSKAVETVAIGAAQMPATAEAATTIFDLLAARFGSDGIDVLYRIIETRPPTGKAAKRASEKLEEPETLERGTPALRIVMELRQAPCEKKADLFARAASEGDERAVKVLSPLKWSPCRSATHPCCFRTNKTLDETIRTLKERSAKK